MRLLILSRENAELKNEISKICASLNLDFDFASEDLSWGSYQAVLMGHGGLRKLGNYIPKMGSLRLIQTLSAGVDMVDFSLIPNSVTLCSNAGAFSMPVAEHAMALAMALSKRLVINQEKMERGEFDQRTESRLLFDSTLGIIGYGGIGKEVARIGSGIGMKVIAIARQRDKLEHRVIGDLDALNRLLSQSDVVVVSIPLNRFTRGLINAEKLGKMKKNAILVNVARAEIIKQEDLYNHLASNPGFSAGIDVWWKEPMSHGKFDLDYPFLKLKNLIASPHNSGIVRGQELFAYRKALENVKMWMLGERPENIVKVEDYA